MSEITEKLDAILLAVKPPALFPGELAATKEGPLYPGGTWTSSLGLAVRVPQFGSLMVETQNVDEVSFRYRFKSPDGHPSVWQFAQLFRVRT